MAFSVKVITFKAYKKCIIHSKAKTQIHRLLASFKKQYSTKLNECNLIKDIENIRTIISNLGYNADDVMANENAHNALPNCCQSLDFAKPKVKKFQLKKPD